LQPTHRRTLLLEEFMSKNHQKETSHQEEQPTAGANKDGTPDMRLKENRNNPDLVAEANEKKEEQAIPEAGHNKDGTPDMRLKENRNNPEIVAEHSQSQR